MDDETRAEFEEMQGKSPVSQVVSGNLLRGGGGGSSSSGGSNGGGGGNGDAEENPMAALQNFDFASWMAGRGTRR